MTAPAEFEPWPKIARLNRHIVVTEKVDGTNSQLFITEDGDLSAGSRTRWLSEGADNFGFNAWAQANKADLLSVGPVATRAELNGTDSPCDRRFRHRLAVRLSGQ
jgi:hypothetical protein